MNNNNDNIDLGNLPNLNVQLSKQFIKNREEKEKKNREKALQNLVNRQFAEYKKKRQEMKSRNIVKPNIQTKKYQPLKNLAEKTKTVLKGKYGNTKEKLGKLIKTLRTRLPKINTTGLRKTLRLIKKSKQPETVYYNMYGKPFPKIKRSILNRLDHYLYSTKQSLQRRLATLKQKQRKTKVRELNPLNVNNNINENAVRLAKFMTRKTVR